ncbi:AlpA family phage regulatory protein [Pseudomonas gessardii]|uniref:AlpA family phage regulatory protein n=2 Tax=Pseudomonas gessardii TaxID=78544 RepID=A0ABS9F5L5_9PSED|nr:AlpA family transcriptional regulator [Pseudomonas gessardii]MCF4977729.1 AlpA family phage regulatory protein [Pseudomonas gessardii]MCF5087959.1 AlpA family phage regulatory protein [Pseudomonas gessardii]MCF5097604.1 AlpA family phage regulatory protein [Pseudomonas gessardii]MCF5107053.1 AlpA family phage regulatory protein [Pseudomonas gessardii]
MSITTSQPRRIMRLPEVKASTGFGRAWIYQLMSEGKFPKARRIGARAVGWPSDEIEQWVNDRMEGRP